MANVNDGHRSRLRSRMMSEGLQSFQDHEVLELLLFQYLPRKDTNKLAHNLLNKFGNFANVLDASPEQLMTVSGISEATACNIAVLKEVWQRYKRSLAQKMELNTLGSIVKYAQEIIGESYVEKLVVVYVDGSTKFLMSEELSSGSPSEVSVDLKKIISSAMRCNAEGVIMFHCHVNGVCSPSEADIAFTQKVYNTLANIGIVLLEHLIFNNQKEYYSFFKHEHMDKFAEHYKQSKSISKI